MVRILVDSLDVDSQKIFDASFHFSDVESGVSDVLDYLVELCIVWSWLATIESSVYKR
jgi:hypothetical protein